VGKCRNCGSVGTKDLGRIGQIAPFVLKRVLNLEYGVAPTASAIKHYLRQLTVLRGVFQKIYGTSVLLDVQICTACSFIQTKFPFPEEGLAKLYVDYRSDSYNRERIHYEPSYAAIVSQVGNGDQEVKNRVSGLTEWLRPKLEIKDDFSMLDYGGADGRFLPKLSGKKHVFEISDIAPVEGITRVNDKTSLESYSYVQLAHVLEHVSYPLALTQKASSYLKSSGHLYIEVPQDLSDETVARLAAGEKNICVPIHEHINYYTVASVTKLMESAGLDLVDGGAEVVDLGWTKCTIIRALGQRN
jgi:hypothetical protein